MVNNIDVHRIQDLMPKPVGKKGRNGQTSDVPAPDASLDVEYGQLVTEALGLPQADEQKVERARELIASGQLDTPENIRETAMNIIQWGV